MNSLYDNVLITERRRFRTSSVTV